MQISPDTDIHLRINRHTAPTWKTCWMRNTAHCWAPRHRDSRVQQDEEDEHKEPKNWSLVFFFFWLEMFKAEVQTGWLTQAPAEGLWEFSLQPEPGFIYTYHSASLHTSRTQKCTTTADTYRTRTINILLSRSGAYSWLQEGSILDSPATSKKKIHGQRRCFQGHAEAINSNLIIVKPLDCKIRAVNTNYRHFKLRHPKNKDFLKEKMCFLAHLAQTRTRFGLASLAVQLCRRVF